MTGVSSSVALPIGDEKLSKRFGRTSHSPDDRPIGIEVHKFSLKHSQKTHWLTNQSSTVLIALELFDSLRN
jgi:hypothetical protein